MLFLKTVLFSKTEDYTKLALNGGLKPSQNRLPKKNLKGGEYNMAINDKKYNTYFRQLLEERNIKQNWLAEQVGMSRQQISLYALGKRPISINAAKRIAYVLEIDFRKLIE